MAWLERGSEKIEDKKPKIPREDEDVDEEARDLVQDTHLKCSR